MATPALSHSVALAPDGEGYLAFDIATGRLLHLNPAAALVAELCDGTRTVDEIAAALSPLFEHADPDGGGAWIRESIESGLLTTTLPDDPLSAAESAAAFTAHTRGLRNQGLVLSAFVCQWHAAHLHASDPSYWFDLGELAHIVGRRAEAREAYERYLEATPDDAEIGHLLISLRDEEPPTRASNRCIEQLYERFASFYDESMRGDLDYRAPELLDRAVRAALKGRSGLNVLELGCGTGLAGRLLRAYAGRLTGIDLSGAMLARAADTNIYDRLEQAEIVTWLGGSDERFDLIAACDTLIYFGDLRQILVPASQHLKRGGLIAFTVEQDDEVMLRLTDSGRYAHHTDHIRKASTDAGLAIEVIEAVTLRYEYGDAVRGLVAVLSLNDAGRVSAP